MKRIDDNARTDSFGTILTIIFLGGGLLFVLAWLFRSPWEWF